jgi:hypothetical protein
MGSTMNVRCTGCGFHGEEQPWGPGMLWQWDFFEHRLFRCVPCARLQSGYVIKPLPALRSAATSERTDWPGPFTLSRQEVAELLVGARVWPKCSVCEGPLGGRSERGDEWPTRCPNCGGALEVEAGNVQFD